MREHHITKRKETHLARKNSTQHIPGWVEKGVRYGRAEMSAPSEETIRVWFDRLTRDTSLAQSPTYPLAYASFKAGMKKGYALEAKKKKRTNPGPGYMDEYLKIREMPGTPKSASYRDPVWEVYGKESGHVYARNLTYYKAQLYSPVKTNPSPAAAAKYVGAKVLGVTTNRTGKITGVTLQLKRNAKQTRTNPAPKEYTVFWREDGETRLHDGGTGHSLTLQKKRAKNATRYGGYAEVRNASGVVIARYSKGLNRR